MAIADNKENTTAGVIVVKWISRYIIDFTDRDTVVYLTVVLTILGAVGNAFSLIVIITRCLIRRSPIYIYVMFINVSDLLYNVLGRMVFVINVFFSETPLYEMKYGRAFCILMGYLQHVSIVASAWLLVAANATKLYALMFPLRSLSRNNDRFAWICCTIVWFLSFASQAPFAPLYILGSMYRHVAGNVTYIGVVCLFDEKAYPSLTAAERHYTLIMYCLVPGLVLVFISIAIIYSFRKASRAREGLTKPDISNTASGSKRKTDQIESAKNSILFLFPMSILHIACTLPICLVVLIESSGICGSGRCFLPRTYEYVRRLIDVNHAVVIYIQLAVSKSFRDAIIGRG